MNPLVSLMTPVYNAMPYLEDYLDCVIAQTWRPLELIISDDGSTDDSAACIEKNLPRFNEAGISVRFLRNPHASQSAAINAALREVSGEYLTWCDADDIMLPECVGKKALYLIEHPSVGMVRNDGLIIDADTGEIVSRSTRESDRHTQPVFRELFLQTTYCYAGCYMVRMSLFDECCPGRRIPESPEGQNLQLLLPAASRTECGFVPDILHQYMKRSSGHSSQQRSYTEKRRRILNFSALFREILPYCVCDRDFYESEIRRVEKTQLDLLNYSAAVRAREEMKKR